MKRKLLATILSVALTASMLIGCGGGAATDAGADTAADAGADAGADVGADAGAAVEVADGETVEIHYAYWHEAMTPYFQECEANFEAANPGVDIVLEMAAWGEYWTKLETAATGGTIADVFHLNGPNNYKYADYGIILPLDDYIASSGVDMSKYPESLNQIYNIDGVQYGIPMDWDTIGLWYNKELFDAAGVSYPTDDWTWEDLVAAAEAITDESAGVYGIAAGYQDQGGFFNTVPAAGGYIISEDGKSSGFSDPATVKGMTIWTDLMSAGLSPSQASLSENADYVQFMSGKIGMVMAGDWYAAEFVADPEFAAKVDVAKLPLIDGNRATCIHGKANCISASTANPDAAWAWVNYLASAEANEILGKSGTAIPAYLDYSDLFFEAYPDFNMSVFSEMAAECAVPYPTSRGFQEWADVLWNELIPAYSLEVSMEDACAKIATQMDDILATYN